MELDELGLTELIAILRAIQDPAQLDRQLILQAAEWLEWYEQLLNRVEKRGGMTEIDDAFAKAALYDRFMNDKSEQQLLTQLTKAAQWDKIHRKTTEAESDILSFLIRWGWFRRDDGLFEKEYTHRTVIADFENAITIETRGLRYE